jgi:hypothetical protein
VNPGKAKLVSQKHIDLASACLLVHDGQSATAARRGFTRRLLDPDDGGCTSGGPVMKLECAQSISSNHVTEAEIRNAFADDSGRGEYIILSEADQVFIQAAGELDGPYALEYREGDANHHFACVYDVKKEKVEAAFMKYLRRDPTWKTDFEWKRLEIKPWWKFW